MLSSLCLRAIPCPPCPGRRIVAHVVDAQAFDGRNQCPRVHQMISPASSSGVEGAGHTIDESFAMTTPAGEGVEIAPAGGGGQSDKPGTDTQSDTRWARYEQILFGCAQVFGAPELGEI